jgi:HTH-type transcriptional regulator/antitoxin HigA
MHNRIPAEVFPPGEFIRDELEERGWTQDDLSKIMARPLSVISLLVTGKRSITPETAIGLSGAFGTSPEFWLNLETAYQLSKVSVENVNEVRQRAALFEKAPVKDMQKRGWIRQTDSIAELEHQLEDFFSIEEAGRLRMAARTSIQNAELTPEQLAWCVRALYLAKSVKVGKFAGKAFESALVDLRRLADFPENIRSVPKVLADAGVRFVIVEHLPKSKIDGAALWLGEAWDKPVIALSIRYDRIDSFWHTLFHECSHIRHKDSYVVDVDLVGADRCLSNDALSDVECRANNEAAEMLIPNDQLRSSSLRM